MKRAMASSILRPNFAPHRAISCEPTPEWSNSGTCIQPRGPSS